MCVFGITRMRQIMQQLHWRWSWRMYRMCHKLRNARWHMQRLVFLTDLSVVFGIWFSKHGVIIGYLYIFFFLMPLLGYLIHFWFARCSCEVCIENYTTFSLFLSYSSLFIFRIGLFVFYTRAELTADITKEQRKNYVTFTRYLTYLGMCIATCVIFQSSTIAASIIGLAVGLYISVSEYWLSTQESPNENPMAGAGGPIPLEDLLGHR